MNHSELIDIFRRKVGREQDRRTPDLYAPLRVNGLYDESPRPPRRVPSESVETILELQWRERQFKGVIEAVGRATPRSIRQTVGRLREWDAPSDLAADPVVLVPYLSDGIVRELEQAALSGIDLNGNYLLLSSELVAIRGDQPNDYPQSRDIKKVYSKNSSIVGRFMLRESRRYKQVKEIYEEIQKLGGGVSLSTVSKVLKSLDEDLLISKKRGEIRLLQPAKLLARLRDGYQKPQVGRTLRLRLPDSRRVELLNEVLRTRWVWTGETSASRYATTTPPTSWVAYTASGAEMEKLTEFEDRRFYNCVLKTCDDPFVYFDSREDDQGNWASPVETYLALSQLDKRERELALSIREKVVLVEFEDV